MFLVSTRNFPPELGGMQNLMEGLSNALLNHGPVKVFADNIDDAEDYDQNSKLSIERVSGFKIFKKYNLKIKLHIISDITTNMMEDYFSFHISPSNLFLLSLKKFHLDEMLHFQFQQ